MNRLLGNVHHMEPKLKPEFVKKLKETEHMKGIPFMSVADLKKRFI